MQDYQYTFSDIATAHESYLTLGYEAIPLKPLSKLPLVKGYDTKPTLTQWYNAPIDSNIGLRAGNGKAFLDCDDKNQVGTFSNVINWMCALGHKYESLPIVQTASGIGRQIYVNYTGAPLLGSRRNFVNTMGAGDFRYGNASFVAAPPSIVDNTSYTLLQGDLSHLPELDTHDIKTLININETVKKEKRKLRMSPLARALAHGKGTERYQSRSEAESALVLSLINSGFDYMGIKTVFENYSCAGHYAEKHKAISPKEADRWLYACYCEMLKFSQNESQVRRKIKELLCLLPNSAWKNASDKNMLHAHLKTAYKTGNTIYSCDTRTLALESSTSPLTASVATRRLIHDYHILSVEKQHTLTLAIVYSLDLDRTYHYLRTPMKGSDMKCPLSYDEWHKIATHDAFRNAPKRKNCKGALGQRAGQIYQSLLAKPQTVKELEDSIGASSKTIKRALTKMSKVIDRATGEIIEMVSLEGEAWKAQVVDLNLIAAIYGTYGATGKKRIQYEKERRDFARCLELSAIAKKDAANEH